MTREVKQIGKSADKAGDALGDMVREGKKAKHMGLDDAADDAEDLERGADKAERSIKALGANRLPGLIGGLRNAEKQIESLSSSSEDLTQKLLDIGGKAAGTIGIGMGAKAAFDVTNDYQKAINTMQAQTGATKAEMEEFAGMASNLYGDNMGESIDDVTNSIAMVKNVTGASGKALEGLSYNALLLRDTFEFEVNESVRAADMLMQQFGISGDQAYSVIAQGAQNGLDKNGDLLDSVNEYSVHFKQLGFDASEMLNMMASGAKSGAFSVDKLGDAVKEFGIRSKDGSKTTLDAFALLGINATKISDDFAHGGEAGKRAFTEVTKRLSAMKDPLRQDAAGVALFGSMWEDLQAKGIFALTKVTGGIDESADALEKIKDVQYDDVGSAMSALGRTVQADLISPIMQDAMPAISNVVDALQDGVSDLGAGIKHEAGGMLTPLGMVGNALGYIGQGLGMALGFITEHAEFAIPAIAGIATVTGVWRAMTLAAAVAENIKMLAGVKSTAVTHGATVAQWLFNASLFGCPAWLVVAGIAAIIGVVGWLIDKVKDFMGLDTSKEKELTVTPVVGGDISGDLEKQTSGMQGTMGIEIDPKYNVPQMGAGLDASYNALPEVANGLPADFGQDTSGFNDSIEPMGYKEAFGAITTSANPVGTAPQMIADTEPHEFTGQVPLYTTPAQGDFASNIPTTEAEAEIQGGYDGMPEYTPENSSSVTNNHNETYNFSPVVTVTVNGSGEDAETEKKLTVKVKKIIKDEFDSVRRKHPRMVEA